jgi:glutathione S-transferase
MRQDRGLMLYHAPMAVCAAKVRMTLAEKKLAWASIEIDLAAGEQFEPAYQLIHPGAVVPALLHDGRIIRDSTVINEYLDDAFAETALRPADVFDRSKMRWWTKQEDDIQVAINTLVTALVLRYMRRTSGDAANLTARHRDPDRRERWSSLIALGVKSPHMDRALQRLARWLGDLDVWLQGNDWLAGDDLSLADVGHAPYINALAMLQLHGLWRDRYPAVETWRRRVYARPSFIAGVTDFIRPSAADAWARAGAEHKLEIERRFRLAAELTKGT